MFEIANYKIFFRHFMYGSALVIGTLLGTGVNLETTLSKALIVLGSLLMIKSAIISWVVNKYPGEFKEYL
jgi:hypothetical protein